MISKYEATGIFMAVAIMAIGLAIWRFHGEGGLSLAANVPAGSQEAVVVAATDGQSQQAALADAVSKAATTDGDLRRLIVDDVRVGTEGPTVKAGDTVTVNYEGTTQNGLKFDSSYDKGEPFTFTVGAGRVIQGWEKGIIGMRAGGERILVIPPAFAYGDAQVGPIPPNSVLVFKIELLSIR
jgi:FKBP-type peptidyl-prolyl cis-trans isomerase